MQLLVSLKMSYTVIFTLLFAIVVISKASDCDPEMCNNVCQIVKFNGTCEGNECYCSFDKSCLDVVCDYVCEHLAEDWHLKGECDANDMCRCKAELEVCSVWDCEAQCMADPRGEECIAEGGILTPDFCLDYGPIRTCGCLCTILNKVKHFLPVKAKKSFYRYNTANLPFYTGETLQRYKYQITSSQSQPTIIIIN